MHVVDQLSMVLGSKKIRKKTTHAAPCACHCHTHYARMYPRMIRGVQWFRFFTDPTYASQIPTRLSSTRVKYLWCPPSC